MKKPHLAVQKGIFIFTVLSALLTGKITAQTVPTGKYNTTNYPEDRKAIQAIKGIMQDSTQFFNDDYIGTGAEGQVYYGYKLERKSFQDHGMVFKSIRPVPNSSFLRIYNGDAAVGNSVVDVVFDSPKGVLSLRVVRTETYIKREGKWYLVSGQGTLAMTKEEFDIATKQFLKAN